MIDKLIYLLDDLKDNYSKQKMDEVLEYLEGEVAPEDLYKADNKFREAFNGQQVDFYNALASQFVSDLNEMPELYFLVWEQQISFFNQDTKAIFYEQARESSSDTDATDFINGLIELDNQNSEIALFHFNRIDDYVASYFTALCYMELDNFENSIKNNLFFLDKFQAAIKNVKTETGNLAEDFDYLLVKYNVHNDLAYAYNRIGDYSKAYEQYEKVLKIFSLDELFSSRHNPDPEEDFFLIDINNMLLSVEKVGKYGKGLELLEFAISKYPSHIYFKELKIKFTEKASNISIADEIITQVFKPRRPYNIEKFEATKLIAREKNLEDMIIEQIKYGNKVFGKEFEVYQDERIFGRQCHISTVNGYLDLLLVEKGTSILYVIELKRNEAGEEVVEQIERYIHGLRKIMPRKQIRGIICLHKPDNKLAELAKTKKDIEVFAYEFFFRKLN